MAKKLIDEALAAARVTNLERGTKLLETLVDDMNSINVRNRGIKEETHARWVREFRVALELIKIKEV